MPRDVPSCTLQELFLKIVPIPYYVPLYGSRKLQSTELPAVSTELRLVESRILTD